MRVTVPACGLLVLAASPALAAWPTEVIEGIGPDRQVPQIRLGVGFDQTYQRASITRESVIDNGSGTRVAGEVSELDYEWVQRRLRVDARLGIYRHLELAIIAPVILEQDSNIRFAEGVEGRSTVYGSSNADDPRFDTRFPITTVPQERARGGFGDLQIGLAWAPVTQRNRPSWPTIRLGALIQLPTGDKWDPADVRALNPGGSGGPGQGVTAFDLSLALSRRTDSGSPSFDPYVELGAWIPIATGELKDLGFEPPARGRVVAGTELVLAENRARDTFYALDFGFSFRYIGEGRTRSQLSDYLPDFNQTAVDRDSFVYDDFADPANYNRSAEGASCVIDPVTGDPMTPGVPCGEFTRVEDHMRFDGHFGVRIQPIRFLRFETGVAVGFSNDHFITGEQAGTDTDPPDSGMCNGVPCFGRINRENSRGEDERSPYFDPRYDAVGGRFRAEDVLNVGFFARVSGQF